MQLKSWIFSQGQDLAALYSMLSVRSEQGVCAGLTHPLVKRHVINDWFYSFKLALSLKSYLKNCSVGY
jgi:hypothetical protein